MFDFAIWHVLHARFSVLFSDDQMHLFASFAVTSSSISRIKRFESYFIQFHFEIQEEEKRNEKLYYRTFVLLPGKYLRFQKQVVVLSGRWTPREIDNNDFLFGVSSIPQKRGRAINSTFPFNSIQQHASVVVEMRPTPAP